MNFTLRGFLKVAAIVAVCAVVFLGCCAALSFGVIVPLIGLHGVAAALVGLVLIPVLAYVIAQILELALIAFIGKSVKDAGGIVPWFNGVLKRVLGS